MTQTAVPAFQVLDLSAGERDLIGLARVSTDAQDAQLQQDALALARCGRVYVEKVSTRKAATERAGPAARAPPRSPRPSASAAPRSTGTWPLRASKGRPGGPRRTTASA